jgi:hypothetical protein
MKEQAAVPPCQGVYKKSQIMGQSDRGVHNNVKDNCSDEWIPGANSNIHQFTGDMTDKDRMLHPV